jgi:hypothetical protein
MDFYVKAKFGDTITCLICNMTSCNLGDVDNLYCGNCHVFLSPREFVILRAEEEDQNAAGVRDNTS